MKQIFLMVSLVLISALGFGQMLNMKSGKGNKAEIFVNDNANCKKNEAVTINISASSGDLDNLKTALQSSLQKSGYKMTANSSSASYILDMNFLLVGKFGGGFLYQSCVASLNDQNGEIVMTIQFEEKLSKDVVVSKVTEQMNKIFK
jgi:hypothetical protein